MSRIVVRCDKCGIVGLCNDTDQLIHKVNNCNGKLEKMNISEDDFDLLYDISTDKSFLQAMIDLKENDIIEYNLKMSQFKSQLEQQKQQQESNTPKCPTCNSTDLKKISGLSKVGSVALWGVFAAGRTSKTWHCNKCGSEW